MDDIARVAQQIVADVSPQMRLAWAQAKEIAFKGPVDLVTQTDREIETLVTHKLRQAFPTHRVIGEEAAASHHLTRPAADEWVWYLDPLDGTVNFAHGVPHFAISLAAARGTCVEFAIVHNPVANETFTARRGQGAWLNGAAIHVSATERLQDSLLATGFPYDRRERLNSYLPYFATFIREARDVRRFGSAALDLCYVACGRFEGFWEWRLHPWDTAAGWLIVEEAGGRLSNFHGAAFDLFGEHTLASNGRIHDEMRRAFAPLEAAAG